MTHTADPGSCRRCGGFTFFDEAPAGICGDCAAKEQRAEELRPHIAPKEEEPECPHGVRRNSPCDWCNRDAGGI